MANTYHQMFIQTVFAVKYRKARIHPDWKHELFAVIGNLIAETGCKTIIVNGVDDHVHCFFSLKPSCSVSEVMKIAKAKSSKWLNETGYLTHRFEWQVGFGTFSYSRTHVNNVFHYIKRQEIHHQKQTFKEEYIQLLEHFQVKYEKEYLFEELV